MRNIGDGSIPPSRRPGLVKLIRRNDPLVMQLVAARRRLQRATAERDRLQARSAALAVEIASLDQRIGASSAEAERLRPDALEFAQARDAATARLLGRPAQDGPVSTALPLLLLPVRLETRFMTRAEGTELWLRIYPDDIHVTDHESRLTEMERQWGENYWNQLQSGVGGDLAQRAWQQLQGQFGPRRAAWIARSTRPGSPQAEIRSTPWGRAPQTEVLPDRFVAVGFSDERPVFTAWGRAIPDTLDVGLDPDAEEDESPAGMPPVSKGLRWLVDFDEAVAQGMAMRIPLGPELASRGLDRLLVLGLKTSSGDSSTAQLQALLESHRYSNGLDLLAVGTPTNNSEAEASAFNSQAESDTPVWTDESASLPADSRGERLARALGLGSDAFAALKGAKEAEHEPCRLMHQLLWEVLSAPLKSEVIAAGTDSAALGRHFAEFVRAMGPLAPLRVGSQPYGILPVTSLMRWNAGDQDSDGKLAAWWRSNRLNWRGRAASTKAFDDSEGALAPLDHGAGSRQEIVSGEGKETPPEPTDFLSFLKGLVQHALSRADAQTQAALAALPEETRLRLAADALDALAYRADAWATSLATSRLSQLRESQANGLCIGAYGWLEQLRPAPPLTPVDSDGAPLWKPPANHGHFQAPSLAQAAAACLLRSGFVDEELAPRDEANAFAVDLSSARVRRSLWLLDGVRQGQSLSSLLGYRFERALHERGLDVYIDRFRRLLALSGGSRLSELLSRLKAIQGEWQVLQSLELRVEALTAEQMAAHGAQAQLQAELSLHQSVIDTIQHLPARAQLLQNEAAQLLQQAAQLNAPRTPSSTQAGQLRILEPADVEAQVQTRQTLEDQAANKQLEASAVSAQFNAAAAGLTQARGALAMLQDPARPASVTALAGRIAALDNALAESKAAVIALHGQRILERRQAIVAELTEQIRKIWNDAGAAAVGKITDGLELRCRWQLAHIEGGAPHWSVATIPFGAAELGFPGVGSAEYQRLLAVLADLDDLVDGVGDVLTAESVFQLVQGNPLRAGASLEAIATGSVPPPDLEMVRTPRSGVSLCHRFICLMPLGGTEASAKWPGSENPRVLAEPRLNAWLAQQLPDPAKIACRVLYRRDQTALAAREVTLLELGLSPLDYLYLTESDEKPQQSELEQRVAEAALRQLPAGVPADAALELGFGRGENWPLERRSFAEFLEMLRALRQLVLSARPLLTQDMALPGAAGTTDELDLAELRQRIAKAVQALKTRRDALEALLALPEPSSEQLRSALLAASQLGVAGTMPAAVLDPAAALPALLQQSESALRTLDERLRQLAEAGSAESADPNTTFQAEAARLNQVFGAEFRVLPLIRCRDATLQSSFDDSLGLQDGKPLAAADWAQTAGKVRDGLARWNTVQLYDETLGVAADLRVGQLPYKAGDRWIALPFADALPQGRLSLVVQCSTADPIRLETGVAGLLVDEWTEIVPHQQEQTGLGFHFDQPNGAPPNSLLLAVAGDTRPVWDLDSLTTILNETLDLAKIRTAPAEGAREEVWIRDSLPRGARLFTDNDAWSWTHRNPRPPNSRAAHQSALAAGKHQHFFDNATDPLYPAAGDRLFVYVYLDPAHPPRTVMLQWNCSDKPDQADWEHRAYWGENLIDWGQDGTPSRRPQGPLPPLGRWCRLEVPANEVGVVGRPISGMAFSLFDGRASWGSAGRLTDHDGPQAATWVSYETGTAGA